MSMATDVPEDGVTDPAVDWISFWKHATHTTTPSSSKPQLSWKNAKCLRTKGKECILCAKGVFSADITR